MANAVCVTGPALDVPSRSVTVGAAPAPVRPIEKTSPPDTGWLSAEITRYVAMYVPFGRPASRATATCEPTSPG